MDSLLKQREAHYTHYLGQMDNQVFHSTDVKPVHVDVYTFNPNPARPYFTLITGGMSDLRQNIPIKYNNLSHRAEIMTYAREPKGWMYNVLKGLAEMPWDDNTFLHWYHSVPNGKPMTATPSELTAFFFVPPFLESTDFNPMMIEGDKVDFLVMAPITNQELIYKREHGTNALLELFDQNNFDYIITENRKSLV